MLHNHNSFTFITLLFVVFINHLSFITALSITFTGTINISIWFKPAQCWHCVCKPNLGNSTIHETEKKTFISKMLISKIKNNTTRFNYDWLYFHFVALFVFVSVYISELVHERRNVGNDHKTESVTSYKPTFSFRLCSFINQDILYSKSHQVQQKIMRDTTTTTMNFWGHCRHVVFEMFSWLILLISLLAFLCGY